MHSEFDIGYVYDWAMLILSNPTNTHWLVAGAIVAIILLTIWHALA